jgi:CO dehydrogenase/acetyl-CoA synthase beta subunit
MKVYDTKGEIEKIRALLSQWEKSGRSVRKYHVSPQKPTAEAIASAKRSVMVFRSDLQTELGGPVAGSSAFVLCTEDNESAADYEVILVGEDIPELPEGTRAFAQVIMVSGSSLDDGEYYEITKYTAPPGLAEGFMVKSTQENIWCRISKTAANSGLRFETLGRRLIEVLKADCPFVEKASVLYVVSTTEDINTLKPVEAAAKAARKEIRSKIWNERGVDLLSCSKWGHCGKCSNKTICDEVRNIQSAYYSE